MSQLKRKRIDESVGGGLSRNVRPNTNAPLPPTSTVPSSSSALLSSTTTTYPTQPSTETSYQNQLAISNQSNTSSSAGTSLANFNGTNNNSSYSSALSSSLMEITLHNIVATINLQCPLDLKKIMLKTRNSEYNPRRFTAVIMRIRDPKVTALIFASGKIVCTGAKSEDDAYRGAHKFHRLIKKIGYSKAKFTDFQLQNVTGSCDVGFPIRLESLAYAHGKFCHYEPELFPGLVYRMVTPKVVLLVFVSGKLVITGAKSKDNIQQAFEKIYPVLYSYRK